jgi:hypothetical protein
LLRCFWLLLALTLCASIAHADPASAPAPSPRPLPELPRAPSLELPVPDPEALEHVDGLLERIRSTDDGVRESALREVLEADASWLPAVVRRLNDLGDQADRAAMKDTLLSIRRKTLEELKRSGSDDETETPDYLMMVSTHPRPTSTAWNQLIQVLALSRISVALGTTPAVRNLIQVYVRFDFLRIDTQRQLKKLETRAVPALIEATRHQAEKVSKWAARQLDALGRGVPSEAVQIEDYDVLSDVLRAYGRIREPDAARIVISFTNSDRAQIREAAREAVALMGEVANWQLRDSYESSVGRKPRRDWSWDRTARELFAEFDALRLGSVYTQFEQGRAAFQAGDLPKMQKAYDEVLTRSPMFDRRNEMVPGYLAFAAAPGTSASDALGALRRSERIATDEAQKKRIASLELTLRAKRQLESGVAEPVLLERALELDASNAAAKELLDRLRGARGSPRAERARYVIAGAILAVALLSIGLIFGIRPKPRQSADEGDANRT